MNIYVQCTRASWCRNMYFSSYVTSSLITCMFILDSATVNLQTWLFSALQSLAKTSFKSPCTQRPANHWGSMWHLWTSKLLWKKLPFDSLEDIWQKYGNTQSMSNTKQASYASLLSTCETCPFAKFWNIASLEFWIDTLQHSQMLPSGPDHSWQSRSVQRDATNHEKTAAFTDCFSIQNWMALAFDLQQINPPCYASFTLKTGLEPTKWYPEKWFPFISHHLPSRPEWLYYGEWSSCST